MIGIDLDYGKSTLEVELPDDATVFTPDGSGEPPPLEDPAGAVRAALAAPHGLPPLRELVGRGSKVAIAFPDRVKGGEHQLAHRKVTLPIVIEKLVAAGVDLADIRLICAVGLHRKNTHDEMAAYLPEAILKQFGSEQLFNHDAEDPDGIVDLGRSELGDHLQFNRACAEADLCIVLGHSQGNPYGGFSGGHKTFTTGLTTWRSIAGHHVPSTMHRPDFVPITTDSHFRSQLRAIGNGIQDQLGKRFFVIDAVIGHGSRILAVFAGDVDEVEQRSWPLARERTDVSLDMEPADILVVGLPRDFHYGPGMGTNPILMGQAIAAVVARAAGAFREGGVVIAASKCDGWFNDEWFPSYQ
ncbi:MAG: lactate racemase domain-containing protein, partial [Nitriliruptoraceae bacterium]